MGKLTCAITGYRPSRFRFKYNENNKDCKRIKRRMEEQFSLLYQKGVHHFKECTISLSEAPWALICGLGKYCWR